MTRLYTISDDYVSVVGCAPAGTDLIEHNGYYFLPLDSGAVVPVTPSQLKSDFVSIIEYPEWMDAATPGEARIGATASGGGAFLIAIEHLDATYLDKVAYVELNGRKFVRA